MAKCPNCDREAARTSDWMCQWCGYPLLSGSYKKLDQTYRELKGALSQPIREEPAAPQQTENIPTPPEPAAPQQTEIVPIPPEPVRELKAPPRAEAPPPALPEAIKDIRPVTEPEMPAVSQPEPEMPPAPIPTPVPVVSTQSPDLEISVAELLNAYETEGPAADARFANKTMRLTGVIERVNIQATLNVYFVILNSPEKSILLQGARCIFDASQAQELDKLAVGQTITVQGAYKGSMIDVNLRNCTIVKH